MEDVSKDDDQIPFNKDSLSILSKAIKNIKDSFLVYKDSLMMPDTVLSKKYDSIISFSSKYYALVNKILSDSADLKFWIENKDSIKILFTIKDNISSLKYNNLLKQNASDSIYSHLNERILEINNNGKELVESKTYILNEFKQETFTALFTNLLNQRKILFLPECSFDVNINNTASSIFYQIKAQLELKDDEPITAELKLKNLKINCYYSENAKLRSSVSKGVLIANRFSVENVSVEFEDGTIKNIFADLNLLDSLGNSVFPLPVRFKNTFPITISSRNDKDYFSNFNIYVADFGAIRNKIVVGKSGNNLNFRYKKDTIINKNIIDFDNIYFILSDLIDYVDVLESNKEDYSPANSVVDLNQKVLSKTLTKERRSQLLNVKAYTDVVGVEGDQPNGLIQIEASRKFNLFTRREGFKNFYIGLATYIEPQLVFSKIEKNNNTLVLMQKDLDPISTIVNKKIFKIPAIDLFRYQNSAFNIDFNLEKQYLPSVKSSFSENINVGILRTKVSDTLSIENSAILKSQSPNDKILNTFKYGFSILYDLKPDSRYGLSLGYSYENFQLLNDDYHSIASYNVVNSFCANAFLRTNDENTLFFKYRISFVSPAVKQNFVQIQLGYSLNLFTASGK